MQKPIVCKMEEKSLECGTEFSDRFVYSNHFAPVSVTFDDKKTPILPEYKKKWLKLAYLRDPQFIAKVKDIAEKHRISLEDLLTKNNVTMPASDSGRRPDVSISERDHPAKDKIKNFTSEAKEFAELLKAKVSESDRGIVDLIERKIAEIDTEVETASEMYGITEERAVRREALDSSTDAAGPSPDVQQAQEIDSFVNALKSDVGYLFLDRTRIRPRGFAVGEHIYSLSLAPGEEVVLEQKTFSKRSVTFEEQTEDEKQYDIELSSTLTNEIQEGFERETSLTDTKGFKVGGEIGGKIKAVDVKLSASYSNDITEANNHTTTRSVKQSQTASSKTASKYRTMHKVTFKLSTEEGYESTSKRVIKNPNRYTPVDLHYFKTLRTLRLSQERYGVRLCWAPCIFKPGSAFLQRISDGEAEIRRAAENIQLPPPPSKPSNKTQTNHSDIKTADRWGLTGDMRFDYDLEILPPVEGYVWDQNPQTVRESIRAVEVSSGVQKRGFSIYMVGDPIWDGSKLKVKVHIGVHEIPELVALLVAGAIVAGPILLALDMGFITTAAAAASLAQIAGLPLGTLRFQATAGFVLPQETDPDYAEWKNKLDAWNKEVVEERKKAREKGIEDAKNWKSEMLQKFNPLSELMSQVIKQYFKPNPPCWEIDLWQNIFDWDSASYVLYPSWWSTLPLQDATKDPADFFNASWARLYLPVKMDKIAGVSTERLALRWLFGKVTDEKFGDPSKEKIFKEIEKDLDTYRKNHFGDEQETNIVSTAGEECPELKEKFICMARWTELMPTDGTHIEVVQSMTSAADEISKKEVDDVGEIRNSLIENGKLDADIKNKALTQITQPASVEVKIRTDSGSNS